MNIELLTWIYVIGAVIVLVASGFVRSIDGAHGPEDTITDIVVSMFWPLFVLIFAMGMVYGIGVILYAICETFWKICRGEEK